MANTQNQDSDARRCPIAGPKQTWQSFERDLRLWVLQTSLDTKQIGAHIVMRGFSGNANFSRFRELLDLDELGKEGGFQYLCTKMQEFTREGAPLLQLRRYMDFENMHRQPGEKPDAFITRWTIAYNQVKKGGLF